MFNKKILFFALLLFSQLVFSKYVYEDCDSKDFKHHALECERKNIEETKKELNEARNLIENSKKINSQDKYSLKSGTDIWIKAIENYCNKVDQVTLSHKFGNEYTNLVCQEILYKNHIELLNNTIKSIETAADK